MVRQKPLSSTQNPMNSQGVRIVTDRGVDRFDAVVMACTLVD